MYSEQRKCDVSPEQVFRGKKTAVCTESGTKLPLRCTFRPLAQIAPITPTHGLRRLNSTRTFLLGECKLDNTTQTPVIPTEATQFSLPISLPVRWLGCVAEGPLFSFRGWVGAWVGQPSPVIPTEATQFFLPISLPLRWLGCVVEGPLFSFPQGCPTPGLGAWALLLPAPFAIPPRPRPRNWPNRPHQRSQKNSAPTA